MPEEAVEQVAEGITTTPTQVDAVWRGQDGQMHANGDVAHRLLANGFDTKALRSNATLRKDEWKELDTKVVQIARQRLRGVADLYSKGLVSRIKNGLGTTVLEYENISDMDEAEVDMAGVSQGRNDRVIYGTGYLPLPIIHKDFQINIRVLNASRTLGRALDSTQAQIAARKVAEKIEEFLFIGSSDFAYGDDGGVIYGYMDEPNINSYTLTADWNDSAASGETILSDVLGMKQAEIDAMHYGPYALYVPTNFETALDDDFKAASDKSIRSRLMEVDGLASIKVADKLTDDNVIMVQLTEDTVRMVEGMKVTTVEWQSQGGMIFHFKVMAIMIPQVRADQDGNSGVVLGT